MYDGMCVCEYVYVYIYKDIVFVIVHICLYFLVGMDVCKCVS